MIYFEHDKLKIFNDNSLTTSLISNNSIDLVITSPPYNVDLNYNSFQDDIPYEDYLLFSEQWISNIFNWLKDDGRFCLNIPLNKNKNGTESIGADLTVLAKKVGFKYHSTIIWNKSNISKRTAWGSWMSASAPYVIAPIEVIIVLYKKDWKKYNNGVSDIQKHEFINWTSGMWSITGESKNRIGHPAPFPLELPTRCIKLFSFVDDIILDPFMGSGTTLISAYNNNRKSIGIEFDKKYCDLAMKRIHNTINLNHEKFFK